MVIIKDSREPLQNRSSKAKRDRLVTSAPDPLVVRKLSCLGVDIYKSQNFKVERDLISDLV